MAADVCTDSFRIDSYRWLRKGAKRIAFFVCEYFQKDLLDSLRQLPLLLASFHFSSPFLIYRCGFYLFLRIARQIKA